MKIVGVLIGIRDHRFYNPLTLRPMKIGNHSSKISLRPLREGGDATHNACLAWFNGAGN